MLIKHRKANYKTLKNLNIMCIVPFHEPELYGQYAGT
jgi:hypothetical protein